MQATSCTYRVALGPHAGKKVLSLRTVAGGEEKPKKLLCAQAHGFSLHAAVRVASHQRKELERLCRYITRPAIANERLSRNAKGQVVLQPDGQTLLFAYPRVLGASGHIRPVVKIELGARSDTEHSSALLTQPICRHVYWTTMRYWLMKSEPDAYSIDDLARDKSTNWNGVRNYQARNFMRDQMQVGDKVLYYHSNCDVPGIVGIAEVSKRAYPDPSQFDKKSKYYDEKSSPADPRWLNVDIRFVKKIAPVTLEALRKHKQLASMRILQRGNRLSITPVDPKEWTEVMALAGEK